MPTARNGAFEVLNFTGLVDLVPRTKKLITELGLFDEAIYGESTIAQVERVTEGRDGIDAKPRGGDRNFAGRESAIQRNFNIPFFPLDSKFTAKDIQDLKAYGTTDTPETMGSRIERTMKRIERSHADVKAKAMYAAIKGNSYSPNYTQSQYDYAAEFGVSGSVITANVDFTDATTDPGSVIETVARAHIIDNAQDDADSYRIIALCGRQWFQALIDHELVRDAFAGYSSSQEPLRTRLSGDNVVRYFDYRGVLFIEDYSGEIATGDAWILPLGIEGMFQLHYAPADTIELANTEAEEMYVFMVSDNHRTQTLETETSMLAVNTRRELVVQSSGTFS
jgi:hypothetical protein